jgi:type IV pilus assembly protein PilQ
MSVYSGQALAAAPEKKAGDADKPVSDVRAIETVPVAPSPSGSQGTAPDPAQVKVSDTGIIESLDFKDANLVGVLQMLSIKTHKNILASKEVRGTVTASLSNVTVKEALDAILKANGYGCREKGNFIYVYSSKELADIEKSERQLVTEVFRLYYTPAANVQPMLKPALSADGTISSSLPPKEGIDNKETGGFSHAIEDIIVIRDYADNMEKIRKIIKEVDRRPQQILVEATILVARLTEDNALGIDFSVIGGVDFASVAANGATFGDVLSGKVIDSAPALPSKGVGAAQTGFTSGVPQGGMRVGLLTNNVAVFVQALESTTNTTVLANPKVLALNKQKGEVLVGREDGYLTTTVTQSTSIQSVEFLQTGTKLQFRPFVGDDGYIRLEVHPEDSDGKVTNGLPSKSTTEITSNIMVKDGHTVVIGGLFRESSSITKNQVPGLGNLPLVGALFRNQEDTTSREEVIILLTPHIVKDDKAYAVASEQAMKDWEKIRVGVRRGMMCFGQERLAENAYNAAVAEMNKPQPNRRLAIWQLDCATNLNPMFKEAIDMKQTLSTRELTTVDNSSIRDFVRHRVMEERAAGSRSAAPAAAPAVVIASECRPLDTVSAPAAPTTRPVATAQPAATIPAPTEPTTRPAEKTGLVQSGAKTPDSLLERKAQAPTAASAPAAAAPAGRSAEQMPGTDVTELPADELPGAGK